MRVLLWYLLGATAAACYLQGHDSGYCRSLADPEVRAGLIPYCKDVVRYTACVPTYQGLPASPEYPMGRWSNHTIQNKDEFVREYVSTIISERISLERNQTLKDKGVDEYGNEGSPVERFYNNPECRNAYKNFFCWLNFPRCSADGETMVMCRSACENFFRACGYSDDMMRCGPAAYFNGYEPEVPTVDADGEHYMRWYFPGQPFRTNEFDDDGNVKVVCTPSILNAAGRPAALSLAAAALGAVVAYLNIF